MVFRKKRNISKINLQIEYNVLIMRQIKIVLLFNKNNKF